MSLSHSNAQNTIARVTKYNMHLCNLSIFQTTIHLVNTVICIFYNTIGHLGSLIPYNQHRVALKICWNTVAKNRVMKIHKMTSCNLTTIQS